MGLMSAVEQVWLTIGFQSLMRELLSEGLQRHQG